MRMWTVAVMVAWAVMGGTASASASPVVSEPATSPESNPDSKRMERAKEYFADEQWVHAIAAFQARAGLAATGELDEITLGKLMHRHDETHERLAPQSGPDEPSQSAGRQHG